MTNTEKQKVAEADFFDRLDYEGGLFEAGLVGLKPRDYDLAPADKDALERAFAKIREIREEIQPILDRFAQSSFDLHSEE